MAQDTALSVYLADNTVQQSIKNVLGKQSQQFTASVATIVTSNPALEVCDRKSLLMACLTAASLDLPINPNLGFAYILPYKVKVKRMENGKEIVEWKDQAQFQMGFKGFLQLSQRSGQFKTINVTDVKEGEIESIDRLTGEYKFEWIDGSRETVPTIGYVAYMKLLNGFEKTLYMTIAELKAHGLKYSKTMQKGFGLWTTDFDAMAKKTVLKLLLAKYAPMTVLMQKAQFADQAIIDGEDSYNYPDNQLASPDELAEAKERQKIIDHIENSKTIDELQKCQDFIPDDEVREMYQAKISLLMKNKK